MIHNLKMTPDMGFWNGSHCMPFEWPLPVLYIEPIDFFQGLCRLWQGDLLQDLLPQDLAHAVATGPPLNIPDQGQRGGRERVQEVRRVRLRGRENGLQRCHLPPDLLQLQCLQKNSRLFFCNGISSESTFVYALGSSINDVTSIWSRDMWRRCISFVA